MSKDINLKDVWRIEQHCCSVCFGRILSRAIPLMEGGWAAGRIYRCADCGIEKAAHSSVAICTCGVKLKGRTNLGLRCEPNQNRTPELPCEIVAMQA